MKKLTLILLTLLAGLSATAQETYRYAERDTLSLYLDIYRPAAGAETTYQGIAKPTILYVFGGGFLMGTRSDSVACQWFNTLNANGYAVVAIDYRLGMKGYRLGKGLSGAVKAAKQLYLSQQMGVEDVFAAVSFLAEHPDLGIDVDNMVVSGSSAGAIISLASAYSIANGTAEGLPGNFRFKGVMSFAGGIISQTGAPKFANAPCPLLLLHGTVDKAVADRHQGAFGLGIWGSSFLADQLKKNNWNYCFWRFNQRGHDVAVYMDYLWSIEKDFLEKNVMLGVPSTVDALVDDPSLPTWTWGKISTNDIYHKKR